MPSRAASAGGGDQQDRNSANRSPMVSRSWSGLPIFGGVVLRRHGLDRELQIFAIGIIDLGNARPVIEHAAERRRARPSIQHAAGRMGKRRGIDLMPLPGVGRTGHRASGDATSTATMRRSMQRASSTAMDDKSRASIKPVSHRAFTRRGRDGRSAYSAHAFFFTSLMLENVCPRRAPWCSRDRTRSWPGTPDRRRRRRRRRSRWRR